MKSVINFDDMIYMPIQQSLKFKKYDWVFVDEAQDTSQTQREMLKALMKPSSRLVAVGDENQALYGFRGADSLSIDGIRQDFSCSTFPLSISYRCSKSVVAEAKTYVPHIEPSESATDGSVVTLDKYSVEDFNKNDAIICRNSAPIVKMAYGLISRGMPVNVRGRDIGKGLISLIKSLRAKDIKSLNEKLDDWVDNQIINLSAKGNREGQIESVNDKADCIRIFISQSAPTTTVQDLMRKIESFFSDDPNGNIVLSTVHSAKGLEFDRCIILDRNRFFPKYATKNWMKIQESNIVYVAITRAKRDLMYISSGTWKD
jgi:superfamily I DNA/RNA helicase